MKKKINSENSFSFIDLDKSAYQVNIFFYFSMKTYVVDTH